MVAPGSPTGSHSPLPRFSPTFTSTSTSSSPDPLSTPTETWVTPLTAPAYFPLSVFLSVMHELSLHPERNSSLILRADPLVTPQSSQTPQQGTHDQSSTSAQTPSTLTATSTEDDEITGRLNLELVKDITLRLLPRQPRRDEKLDQRCLFYQSPEPQQDEPISSSSFSSSQNENGLVIMQPLVHNIEEVPFYHPAVKKLAFRWEALPVENKENLDSDATEDLRNDSVDTESGGPQVLGKISISYLPFPHSSLSSSSSSSPYTSTPPIGLSSLRPKPKRRSPLAGPEPSAPPPAVILPPIANETTPIPLTGVRVGFEQATEERLNRTCLALLERLHKHGVGKMSGYKKKRFHDVVVPREAFQDLYLVLKDRHRQLDSRVPRAGSTKIEDVKRHVWKAPGNPDDADLPTSNLSDWGAQDVAIAAFLMLLWKDMYPPRSKDSIQNEKESETDNSGLGGMSDLEIESNEWDNWGRPEGGFIDLGCGNGLLVHILTSEGYKGVGYELRARRTWPQYPKKTQEALIELPIDMPSWFPMTIEEWDAGVWEGKERCVVKEGAFLIGNHADELTPWLPLLSLLPSTPVPHLSLPCCFHTLDGPFTSLSYNPPPHPHLPEKGLEDGLDEGVSRYKSYVMWLGWCGLMCGWEWEKEGLRIPSTRGWGIVARKRWVKGDEDERRCRVWALGQVNEVRQRGDFKIREKEGKEH